MDSWCGSVGMFVQSICGQESQRTTWLLVKMNLVICIIAHNLYNLNESTFEADKNGFKWQINHKFEQITKKAHGRKLRDRNHFEILIHRMTNKIYWTGT